jgi:signal recognition particle receptor subunit beta
MGKSVKRIKLGRSDLTIFDMGGQRDFWVNWVEIVKNSPKIIYIFDGTANNEREVVDSLKLVLENRSNESGVLILMNKLDLIIDGYTSQFIQVNDLIQEINTDLNDVWLLKSSVFNGKAYMTEDEEERNLAEIIYDFLLR